MSLPTYEEDSLRFNITKTGKYYETGLTRTVSEILSTAPAAGLPKAAVIDVGCNAGWYTLYSAAIFREQGSAERQVYCFEANPNLHPRLQDSVQFNRDFANIVNLVHKAVADKEGEVTFSWNSGHYGGGSMTGQGGEYHTTVQTTSLDTYFKDIISLNTPILFLKIDVEGFECMVMRGAVKLLQSKLVRNVFVELSFEREEETGCTAKEWLLKMMEGGYAFRVGHNAAREPIPREELDDFLLEMKGKLSKDDKFRAQDIWLYLPEVLNT